MRKTILKKLKKGKKLDIYEISIANLMAEEYKWNPKIKSSSLSNEEILKENRKKKPLKKKVEKIILKNIKNKTKKPKTLRETKKEKIILDLKNLMIIYINKKTKKEFIRCFELKELNLI